MKIGEILKRIFVERYCLVCGDPISYDFDEPFCKECIEDWRELKSIKCRSCGRLQYDCTCLPKYAKKINHSIVVWCVFYDTAQNGSVNQLFTYLKRKYDRQVIDFCTDKMKQAVLAIFKKRGLDLKGYYVTYAPRSKSNVNKFGFDHSRKLALSLAKKLELKVKVTFKNKGKTEQKELNKRQRVQNAAGAYSIIPNSVCKGDKLLLVDDILTTGATMYTCALQLYKNGAESVVPVVFAKDNYVTKGENKNVKRNSKYYFARAFKGFV